MRIKHTLLILIIGIFVLVLVPIYFFAFSIFRNGYVMADKNVSTSISSSAYHFVSSLEDEVSRIKVLHQKYLNDEDIVYYANVADVLSPYEQASKLLSIQDKLELLRDSSEYIEDVVLWIPGCSKKISASRGVDDIDDDWNRIITEEPIKSEANLIEYDSSLYLCTAYPMYYFMYGDEPNYILAIKFSSNAIEDMLRDVTIYENCRTILSDGSGKALLTVGNNLENSMQKVKDIPLETEYTANAAIVSDSDEEYLMVDIPSEYLGLDLYTYTPSSIIYSQVYRYQKLFVIFTIAAFLLAIAYFITANHYINLPIKRLISALNDVETGNLDVQIQYRGNDDFKLLYESFNHMTVFIKNMMEQNAKQRALTEEADFRQLQAQINPHFLYNSFFILYRMAKDEDYDNITTFLTYLSDYYRYITRNESMEATLADEDGHARIYVKIQLIRFKKKLSAKFDPLPENCADVLVPRLIIQPLIENAFEHGLKDTVEGGKIRIWYELINQSDKHNGCRRLLINVEDNGIGMSQENAAFIRKQLKSGIDLKDKRTGIINIHQRIQLKYGREYGIQFETGEKGTHFSVLIPISHCETDSINIMNNRGANGVNFQT